MSEHRRAEVRRLPGYLRRDIEGRPQMRDLDLAAEVVNAARECAEEFVSTGGLLGPLLGPNLRCAEAEALAGLLRACGYTDAANDLIDGHALGDEEGDDHYEILDREGT